MRTFGGSTTVSVLFLLPSSSMLTAVLLGIVVVFFLFFLFFSSQEKTGLPEFSATICSIKCFAKHPLTRGYYHLFLASLKFGCCHGHRIDWNVAPLHWMVLLSVSDRKGNTKGRCWGFLWPCLSLPLYSDSVISGSPCPISSCWILAIAYDPCFWEKDSHCQEEHSYTETECATYQVLPVTNSTVTPLEDWILD